MKNQQEQPKYTQGEWKVVLSPVDQRYIVGEDGLCIATVHTQADGKRNEELKQRQQANAERILKCVNMHDELVEALNDCKAALIALGYNEWYQVIEADKLIKKSTEI